MSTLLTSECLIALVEEVKNTGEDIAARLHTKQSVRLAKHQPNWSEIRQRIEDSFRRRVPVGLWLDRADQVIGAGWAERDYLLNILEQDARPGWCWVYFATGGSYPLRKSNPAFSRIREAVQHCRETRAPAWMVTRSGAEGVELVDVQVLHPEEDELLCRLSNLGWV